MTTLFGRVYDHAVALLPQLAARNNSPTHVWLSNACDPDLDITRLAEKNPAIGAFSYFTTAVMKARDERVKAEETFNPPALCAISSLLAAEITQETQVVSHGTLGRPAQ